MCRVFGGWGIVVLVRLMIGGCVGFGGFYGDPVCVIGVWGLGSASRILILCVRKHL